MESVEVQATGDVDAIEGDAVVAVPLTHAEQVQIAEAAILFIPHPISGETIFIDPSDKRMKLLSALNVLGSKRAALEDRKRDYAAAQAKWQEEHAAEKAAIDELEDTVAIFDAAARNLARDLFDGENKKILPAGLAEIKMETSFAYNPEDARAFAMALADHVPGLVKIDARKLESLMLAVKPHWAREQKTPKVYLATNLHQHVLNTVVLETLGEK